jgi:tetratricopeptide (TPR) repeat protein
VASAQVVPDRELETVRFIFNAGNYALALQRAQDAMGLANFTEPQRVDLHKYAGLSAFNLGDTAVAERHFLQLLQINPDYVLDPFAVPPPAIKLFEDVKRRNVDSLNLIRQTIALREEQARREQAERDRRKQLEDAERRRLDELARNVQVKVVEKRPWIINLLPFGAGQFFQGRTEWGIFFATTQTALALTSVVSYWAIFSLFTDEKIEVNNVVYGGDAQGKYVVHVWKIKPELQEERQVWEILKWSTGAVFYALWALGAAEALWHHKGEVVTYQTQRAQDVVTPSKSEGLKPMLNIFPLPGGAGAGMTMKF